jgi:CubicO group peptidase (beta-lactamase class C family)
MQKTGPYGHVYEYFSLNTEVLGWIIERVTHKSVTRIIQERIWQKMGPESDGLMFLSNGYDPIYMGGMSAILRDHACFGLLFTPSVSKSPYNIVPKSYLTNIQKDRRSEILKIPGQLTFIFMITH